ncbi:MAG: primary-amine oxidase [Alphaproteobacteria bacterium]|nr:primary-amine oxidase [Alphaproteobacteria bacterium]
MDDFATTATMIHPLDPLGIAELAVVRDRIAAHPGFNDKLRYSGTELREPPKPAVLAWRPGEAVVRAARSVLLDTGNGDVFEVITDLNRGAVASWEKLPLDQAPYGQPGIILDEFFRIDQIVKSDPAWIAAVKRRGITDADLPLVQVDPFSAGNFLYPEEQGRRLVRAVSYWRGDIKDNGYAHPIEGVVAVVDLIANRILTLVDDPVAIPIPRRKRNYGRDDLPPPRTDLKPLNITQPEGPSFATDGWEVRWQDWRFRVGFTPREGLVLHQLSIQDRPVIYRASITEMVVPYADPTTNHYWKNAFDAGEYGLGKLANQLELGCDCKGLIRYFDIPAQDDHGTPELMKNAVCMHEEDYGILWKHYEFRNGIREARRSRRLVISFFATVGNYDYGFFWYLYQDGTIQLEGKLTGIIQTAAVAPGAAYPWGGMVAEQLGGPTHQHFFNARLHMMVDGERNTVTEHEFQPRPWGTDNPHGNVFDVTSRTLSRELDAAREADGRTGRYWKISNPNATNSVGKPPAYKLAVMPSPLMLAQEGSAVRKRAGFATKHVWVTKYDPKERFAAGEFPNQHQGGDGLPAYVAQNRPIENEDIVLWHTFGHTHVCKPEDFPIMPVEYAGFMLKPNGFFAENPAMNLPDDAGHDVQDGDASCCCS